MDFADTVLRDVRRVLGVRNEKVVCGVDVMMHSRRAGLFEPSGCGRLRCRTCGPMNVASKIGAVLMMPVVNNGKAVGEPIGKRPVWVYAVENRRFDSFWKRWSRECPKSYKLTPRGQFHPFGRTSCPPVRVQSGEHPYPDAVSSRTSEHQPEVP